MKMQVTYTITVDEVKTVVFQMSRLVDKRDSLAIALWRRICDQFQSATLVRLDRMDLGIKSPGQRFKVLRNQSPKSPLPVRKTPGNLIATRATGC
jgi:hypothetical protein